MNAKKPLLIAGLAAGITLAGLTGINAVSAATTKSSSGDSSSIVDKIASKFGLNKDEVQKVFDENRASHEAEHQQKLEARLDKAVSDGKITADQKTKILAKLAELKTFQDSLKDKTKDERHTAMEQKITELRTWATDNNIPAQYMHMMGHGGRGGPGHHKGGMTAPDVQ